MINELLAVVLPPQGMERLDTKFFYEDQYGMYVEKCIYMKSNLRSHELRETCYDLRMRLAFLECNGHSVITNLEELTKYSMLLELMR